MHYRRLTFSIVILLAIASCKTEKANNPISSYSSISGETMGTTYHISYKGNKPEKIKHEIDSILVVINNSLSTYIPTSTIGKINNDSLGASTEVLLDSKAYEVLKYQIPNDVHFNINFKKSLEVFHKSEGFFDPTVMPLVNYWGFGYTAKKAVDQVDSLHVSDLMQSIGFHRWQLSEDIDHTHIIKPIHSQLDFSGIAKGFAVDIIGQYFNDRQIDNYLVEIGGELYAKGNNSKDEKWSIALNRPKIESNLNDVQATLKLQNVGLASSGNYRNFHVLDGKYYGHEINPKTGYPEINDLLGVSVIAVDCMTADAYATAFMIMGLEKSKILVEKLNDVEACFFISDSNGKVERVDSHGFLHFVSSTQ